MENITTATTAAKYARFDVVFNDETNQVDIVDAKDELLFTMDIDEDEVRIFVNGGESVEVETGFWNYRIQEPETRMCHYSEIELDHNDYFTYAMDNREKWGVGVALDN